MEFSQQLFVLIKSCCGALYQRRHGMGGVCNKPLSMNREVQIALNLTSLTLEDMSVQMPSPFAKRKNPRRQESGYQRILIIADF
jgi:hypothetical protein